MSYLEGQFPPNEFVELGGLLYPHAVWLDAINTAGLQIIAERTKGSRRQVGRALQNLKTPEAAKLVRQRAKALVEAHCEGLDPSAAPDGWRLVGVAAV